MSIEDVIAYPESVKQIIKDRQDGGWRLVDKYSFMAYNPHQQKDVVKFSLKFALTNTDKG